MPAVPQPSLIVVMGVTGAGKTTIGRRLATALGVPFFDADDAHSADAKDKMRAGIPLTESDRVPWLERLNATLREHEPTGLVLACSALTADARRRLTDGVPGVRFVFLTGDPALIHGRIAGRSAHFAGPELLPSQLDTLEPPADAVIVDVAAPPDEVTDRALEGLRPGHGAAERGN